MNTKFIKIAFSLVLLFAISQFSNSLNANNLQITNVSQTGDLVEFDLAWENSWNVAGAPSNHDAVWVFIKYRECGTGPWTHALLSTTMSDHTLGSAIDFATPILTTNRLGTGSGHNTGAMIMRSDIAIGHITTNNSVSLKLDGSPFTPGTDYEIRVFGIEMVFITEGAFTAGDGAAYYAINEVGEPILYIDSEDPISLNGYSTLYSHTMIADFPKGYASFYIMKYEITHGQYCDFLNTMNGFESSRYYNYNYYRHDLQTGAGYITSSTDRALNYMSFQDLLSYLDWAALRPMTELEFEKACRGPLSAIALEQAWGSAATSDILEVDSVSGATAGVEISIDNPVANCHINVSTYSINGGQFTTGGGTYANRGPVAVGIFARTSNTRLGTGATYYGVMEMSGNVWEQCISTMTNYPSNNPSPYTGEWGDGDLTNGIYDVVNWPTSGYFIKKGGSYYDSKERSQVSDRNQRANTNYTARGYTTGGRGCR